MGGDRLEGWGLIANFGLNFGLRLRITDTVAVTDCELRIADTECNYELKKVGMIVIFECILI